MPIKVDVRTPCTIECARTCHTLCECASCLQNNVLLYEFCFTESADGDGKSSLFLCPRCVKALHAVFHSITGEEMD